MCEWVCEWLTGITSRLSSQLLLSFSGISSRSIKALTENEWMNVERFFYLFFLRSENIRFAYFTWQKKIVSFCLFVLMNIQFWCIVVYNSGRSQCKHISYLLWKPLQGAEILSKLCKYNWRAGIKFVEACFLQFKTELQNLLVHLLTVCLNFLFFKIWLIITTVKILYISVMFHPPIPTTLRFCLQKGLHLDVDVIHSETIHSVWMSHWSEHISIVSESFLLFSCSGWVLSNAKPYIFISISDFFIHSLTIHVYLFSKHPSIVQSQSWVNESFCQHVHWLY